MNISELETKLSESDDFLQGELTRIENQRKEAYELYESHRDEAFASAFRYALKQLNLRGKALNIKNGDVVRIKKELREIERFVKKGYDSGKLLEERKKQLEQELEASKQAESFKEEALEIPVRVKRYTNQEANEERYEVSHPFEPDNPLAQDFGSLFFNTFFASVDRSCWESDLCKDVETYIIPDMVFFPRNSRVPIKNMDQVLNKVIKNSRLKKANIRVRVYEEQGEIGFGELVSLLEKKIAKGESTIESTEEPERTQEESSDTPYMVNGVEAYNAKQLQKRLNYTEVSTVYALGREGKIERIKGEDGRMYFPKKSFEEYLERRRLGTRKKSKKKLKKKKTGVDNLGTKIKKCLIKGMSVEEITEKLGVERQRVAVSASNQGHYSEDFIKRKYNTLDLIGSIKFPRVSFYYGKDEIRKKMLEHIAAEHPNPRELSVLSLEGPNFRSYIEIAKRFGVDPEKCVIPEKNDRSYLIMQSILRNSGVIEGGEIFEGLNVVHGDVLDVVEGFKPGKYKFEAVNLDYTGAIDSKKINTVRGLFLNELLASNALLFMTLNNSPRRLKQVAEGSENLGKEYAQGFGTEDQRSIMNDILDKQTFVHNYDVRLLSANKYSAKETPMLHLCYALRRVD